MKPQSLEKANPDLLSQIKRNVNSLKQSQARLRKQAITDLFKIVKEEQLSVSQFQEIAILCNKDLLKCLYDQTEFIRENALLTIIELLPRVPKVSYFIPYILAAMIDRTNCIDLEGIANVPQKMRPAPGQKPKMIVKIVENCEQIRMKYVALMHKMLSLVQQDQIRDKLDEIVNILRALVMDPCSQIQKAACETLQFFCKQFHLILLHYTQIIGRALLLPLVSKKSKVRIAALHALTALFWVGLWKYNAFVFENLVGFRDPNSVPIKDFYEPSNNVNYLATFANDPNIKVRLQFIKCLKIWTCQIDDKYDHHGRLVPYILSGLIDLEQQISKEALEILHQIGRQIEIEKEKQFRQGKQYAIDAAWTWQGQLINLPVQAPLYQRQSLGSRVFVRGHVRKFWTALYKQIKDINYHNRIRAAKLTLYGIIYTQNYMTQYLDVMIPHLLSSVIPLQQQDKPVSQLIQKSLFYLGRFCDVTAYVHVIKSSLKGQLVQSQQFLQATIKGLSKLVQGCLDSVPLGVGLCHKKQHINLLLSLIQQCEIYNQIYGNNCYQSMNLVMTFLQGLKKKASKQDLIQIMETHFLSIVKLLAASYYQINYNFAKNADNDQYVYLRKCFDLVAQLHSSYFTDLDNYMRDAYMNPPSIMDADWKLITVVHNLLTQGQGEQEAVIFQLAQQVIAQCLAINRSVQILSFLYKYIPYLFSQVPQKNKLVRLSVVLIPSLLNFNNFKPIKKVPVYDQHLIKPETDPTVIRLIEDIFIPLFENCSQSIQTFYMNKVHISFKQLAQIIFKYLHISGKFIKNNVVCQEAIKTLWIIFSRIELSQQIPEKMTFQENGETKIVFETIIDFIVQRLQTMVENQHQKVVMLFDIFENLIKCCPTITSAMHKLPSFYADYPRLLQKLFKYAMDERDIQIKQKYNKLLIILCSRLKPWFQLQLRLSEQGNRFARVNLLKKILQKTK